MQAKPQAKPEGPDHNTDRCTSCGLHFALLDLHDLTGQCPACFDENQPVRDPGDHHPLLWALQRASYAAFDLGSYAKADGFAIELRQARDDLKRNPKAYH
jgi:hypothetical protein